MSQRFTVTAGDIQGEVNQLFEGDEPTPGASAQTPGADAKGKAARINSSVAEMRHAELQISNRGWCLESN
ncbi:hypothetical protein E1301_Tti004785 [Triplophysa tibetana]|uniref:Uncharacterized protein n=1 Tax=Triplophysa tibetana TaxID=1572043 RepID=A0A5A9NT31_9TELE|nr:hypothetical protein E1301_Tti004785 [Triplophysa tibetana]